MKALDQPKTIKPGTRTLTTSGNSITLQLIIICMHKCRKDDRNGGGHRVNICTVFANIGEGGGLLAPCAPLVSMPMI